jgi:hypothetical protein
MDIRVENASINAHLSCQTNSLAMPSRRQRNGKTQEGIQLNEHFGKRMRRPAANTRRRSVVERTSKPGESDKRRSRVVREGDGHMRVNKVANRKMAYIARPEGRAAGKAWEGVAYNKRR